MAELNPAGYLQNSTVHTARAARHLATALISEGIWSTIPSATTGDMAVTAAGGNMTVNIAAGGCYVKGDDQTGQGSYGCYNDASVAKTLAGGGAGARVDLIIARVYDQFIIGGGTNLWQLEVVDGTSVAPAVPATPASAFKIAEVAVGAGVTSISNANITDRRTTAAQLRPGGFLTADLANAQVTADKLKLLPATGSNNAQASRSFTTYGDCNDTANSPSCAITVGANGIAIVHIACRLWNGANQGAYMSFDSSNGEVAASDSRAITNLSVSGGSFDQKQYGNSFLLTGLTPGAFTFRAKYKVHSSGGTGQFMDRLIWAVPL